MPLELLALFGKYVALPLMSALVGVGIKGWVEDRRFFKLDGTRKVDGIWRGELKYVKPRWEPDSIEIVFYRSRFLSLGYWLNSKLVTGLIRSGDNPEDDVQIQGGFYQPDQLMLDYRSAQKNRRQFGSLILKLDAGGSKLHGNFIGYYDQPLAGTITLERIANKLTS